MITVNQDILIPNQWEELTPEQAVSTVALLEKFFAGELTLEMFRIQLLVAISGYEPEKKKLSKFPDDKLEKVHENLYLLSELMRFPIKPRIDNPEVLEVLDEALQYQLQTMFPFEIIEPEWSAQLAMVDQMLKVEPAINLNICKNLIPKIAVDGLSMYGPVFNIDKHGIVATDMLAAEYVDAYEFFNLYNSTKEDLYLDTFVSTLYRQNRKAYSTFEAQQNAALFRNLDGGIKKVVYLWFQSLLEYMHDRSPYKILFNRKKSEKEGFVLGLGDTIYTMAGKGYGNKTEVESFPLPDYFAIMLRELVDAVKSMKDMDMKMHDIEEKTGLSAELIAKI